MTTLTAGPQGQVALPEDVRERYGVRAETPLRIVETRHGILLVPLTDEPMSEELARELEEWQELSATAWEMFPCSVSQLMAE